jgi:hypothetical protein
LKYPAFARDIPPDLSSCRISLYPGNLETLNAFYSLGEATFHKWLFPLLGTVTLLDFRDGASRGLCSIGAINWAVYNEEMALFVDKFPQDWPNRGIDWVGRIWIDETCSRGMDLVEDGGRWIRPVGKTNEIVDFPEIWRSTVYSTKGVERKYRDIMSAPGLA